MLFVFKNSAAPFGTIPLYSPSSTIADVVSDATPSAPESKTPGRVVKVFHNLSRDLSTSE